MKLGKADLERVREVLFGDERELRIDDERVLFRVVPGAADNVRIWHERLRYIDESLKRILLEDCEVRALLEA